MKTLIIYHRVDYDGIFSACIVKKFIPDPNPDLLGYNYGDPISLDRIMEYEKIYMVDVSFEPAIMCVLTKRIGLEFTWIDHHITAINNSVTYGYSEAAGIRGLETSAAEFTWKYLSGGEEVPDIVKYISTYDSWKTDRMCWDDVMAVQYALRARYGIKYQSIQTVFEDLCSGRMMPELLGAGRYICQYNKGRWESAVNSFSFPVTINGRMKGICILGYDYCSTVFESVFDKYDLYCVVNRKSESTFSISMYGLDSKIGDFNCGEYMKANYKGGGHKGAAGGILNFWQFKKLITLGVL